VLAYRTDGPIAYLALARPEKLNAMTRAFWGELREGLDRAAADADVRAVIFHGEGRCFSVGGDIEGFGDLGGAGDRRSYVGEALGALRAVDEFPKPTIAAVHGHALGGGCELTLVCDIVVADETARFGTPEAQVGLVPGLAMARGLAQCTLHWLKYMVLTGEALDADEARLAGLVNRVVPAGGHLDLAESLARIIATRAPLALSLGKQLLSQEAPSAYGRAIDGVAFLQGTADFAEGVAAFGERRAARFEGS
jgi:enoyl-CoA hydratase/carnithine racemase